MRLRVQHVVGWALSLFRKLCLEVVLLIDVIKDLDEGILWLPTFDRGVDAEPVDHAV